MMRLLDRIILWIAFNIQRPKVWAERERDAQMWRDHTIGGEDD